MEESGKRRMAFAGVAFLGLAYFFICAKPLPRELVLSPVWAHPLSGAAQTPPAVPARSEMWRSFQFGGRFGYFLPDGTLLFASPISYGVALSDTEYATYERLSEGFIINSPDGSELARCKAPGYPFFKAGRRFLISPGQFSVSELGSDGNAIWNHTFGAVATSFDASPLLAVFGLLDGRIVGIDPKGKELLDFAPGGSRIACVYGIAVSPDSSLVAVLCGIDRQRLVILEKGSSAYRVVWHRWLDTDFRRPVSMAFTADGKRLIFEAKGGLGVWERDSRTDHLIISAGTETSVGLAVMDRGFIVLLSGIGKGRKLLVAEAPDRKIVNVSLPSDDAFLDVEGSSIFIGADGTLARMDLREE